MNKERKTETIFRLSSLFSRFKRLNKEKQKLSKNNKLMPYKQGVVGSNPTSPTVDY